ncbi:MAG: hypothetical protein FD157_2469 [Rhodocyclaceae bacterium]|nr:MAG: hypothetical protein FD157_2469 [Rhodocyclaceae bacterium]TND00845.1 MAG: hypothetical protein FD118_2910 [Rhodocyclaceae bacterium]
MSNSEFLDAYHLLAKLNFALLNINILVRNHP